jgi:hypothetical protein
MADKKFYWIKLKIDFFSQETVDFIMSQKNGCEYIVLYQMLCLKAANSNGSLSSKIGEMIVPYDVEKIVRDTKYFDFDTVAVALELFKKIGLIYVEQDKTLTIANYAEMIGCEPDRTNAERQKRYRERQKQKAIENIANGDNVISNVTERNENNVEIRDKRLEIRDKSIDIEKEREEVTADKSALPPPSEIVELFNSICISYPKVKSLSENRKKAIKARLKTYGYDTIRQVFEKAEASDFMKGKNNRNWSANFDWILKDSNFVKILDGNYDNKPVQQKNTGTLSGGYTAEDYEKIINMF